MSKDKIDIDIDYDVDFQGFDIPKSALNRIVLLAMEECEPERRRLKTKLMACVTARLHDYFRFE